jgi:ABC-type glucose/galactose transport system permease subunit
MELLHIWLYYDIMMVFGAILEAGKEDNETQKLDKFYESNSLQLHEMIS